MNRNDVMDMFTNLKVARELVAVKNHFKDLKLKKLDLGAKRWDGKIDGVNVAVVWNPADRGMRTTSFWDISVGKSSKQTNSNRKVSQSEANKIIDEFLNKEVKVAKDDKPSTPSIRKPY